MCQQCRNGHSFSHLSMGFKVDEVVHETNGFPLGRENVIKINSEQIVAIISD